MIPTRLPARGAGHRAFLIGMLGLAVAGAVAFVGSSPAHAATPQPVFGMRPSAEGQVPLPGGHFTYSVPAGSTLTDAVVVENLTERPLSLQLFGADLIPLQGGGFGVTQLGQKTQGVGSWTKVAQPTVDLAPGEQRQVAFTVQVPKESLSGDYGGAVVAQNGATQGTGVAVQFRVGLEIQIHVTGQNPRLAAQIGPLSKQKSGRSMEFTATVTNTGNESFVFDGTIHLREGGRNITLAMSPDHDYLYPGQQVTLKANWSRTPIWGSAHAQASVTVTAARSGSGTFTDRDLSMRFLPWWLVLMAILALLLLLVALVQAWRNRKEMRRRLVLTWRRRQAVRRFKGQLDLNIPE